MTEPSCSLINLEGEVQRLVIYLNKFVGTFDERTILELPYLNLITTHIRKMLQIE